MQEYIKINDRDSVAVALKPLQKGLVVSFHEKELILQEDIMQGHKFALHSIEENEAVIKYGFPIGTAKEFISQGSWVHTHNLKTTLQDILTYEYDKQITELEPREERLFLGYQRENGKVGVRNEIWIIPTVGCMNNVATAIEKEAKDLIGEGLEDIVAFPHPYGCSQMGDDQENTRTILADLINHPNAGGVLVLGLGCENSHVAELKKYIGEYDPRRVKFLIAQEVEDEMEEARKYLEELAEYVKPMKRVPLSSSNLIIGMKCGGSDGLSGITANSIVGEFSDILISQGGSTMLTEVPEMFGAETLLMNRCETEELFHKTVALINNFKEYFQSYNLSIYENPSPGNKQGGISTLEDKSLGCTQKSGNAPIKGVLDYGEPIKVKGLNLLSAPGNDLVAATALAASGAHIVLFTTGRGTPFACPVPTVKISSNSALFAKKGNWIDFNAGSVIEDKSIKEVSEELFEYVLRVASGEKVKSEDAGFHDMAIFKKGVTL